MILNQANINKTPTIFTTVNLKVVLWTWVTAHHVFVDNMFTHIEARRTRRTESDASARIMEVNYPKELHTSQELHTFLLGDYSRAATLS